MLNNKKGQFFSYDAIVGGVIFLIAVALLLSYWFGTSPAMQKESDLARETLRLSDTLATPGNPADWHERAELEIKQIGLTTSYDKTEGDEAKFTKFAAMNYETVKDKLNFAYDFNVTIIGRNGDIIARAGKCDIQTTPVELVEVNRVAVYKNDLVRVKINAWYEK